ncbi:dentin sialophosphoprotein-like protein [Rhynchospora pubera]|uniref:Dentin sialophosphoprotein-like protein n=1 Tax=Rhynchospora pubera TaxID=906938 RepID=A0AAV8D9A1_9POAL|nr:dentin sialophosphoprotein-like protein [Rhynchospora pubera]
MDLDGEDKLNNGTCLLLSLPIRASCPLSSKERKRERERERERDCFSIVRTESLKRHFRRYRSLTYKDAQVFHHLQICHNLEVMSQFPSWQNQDAMQLLQQQLLHNPNSFGQISVPNVTNERILPQSYQLPLVTTMQSCPQYLSQSLNYPSQVNPLQVAQFLPEQGFSQECTTNNQHNSGLTSLDPTEERILFGSDDDVSSTWVTSQGNAMTQDGSFGNFSSVNSGSWSALMQDVVEASSSEMGLREEWSCLSFQKPEEPSISNNSSTLTANQPSNFVINEGQIWNLPSMAVNSGQNLYNLSAQYSVSENPHFATNQQMKGMEELTYEHAFQSSSSKGGSMGPLANFYTQHITPLTSQIMLEHNQKAERATRAPLDSPKSATTDSSNSHVYSPLNQISLQKQFIPNQSLADYQYPSVHLNPNQLQIDHFSYQSNILDSERTFCSQNAFLGSFGFTKMTSDDAITNPNKSVNENSLNSMVNNLENILSVQQTLASMDPSKVIPSIFQSKMEGDNPMPGSIKISRNSLNQEVQDQKKGIHDGEGIVSISSDEVKFKEHSYISGNTGLASRTAQGHSSMIDATPQFDPQSPKRSCAGGLHELEPRPKRQKADASSLISWFRIVDGSHQSLCSTRIKEHSWEQATNRLIEKVEDLPKLKEDVPIEARSRKRLILTVQLTGRLFPTLQYRYLTEDATLAYKKITYCAARSALEEACTLIASTDSSLHSNAADRMHQNFRDKSGESTLSKAVENIMQKSNMLESNFLRLDKRSSVLDLKLMWQELERYALVSCLGKFHTQSRHVNPGGPSSSQTAHQGHLARRHATLVVLQTDTAFLHGVPCLSL